jgi:ribonuclease BN (tRNA processing enzyme)
LRALLNFFNLNQKKPNLSNAVESCACLGNNPAYFLFYYSNIYGKGDCQLSPTFDTVEERMLEGKVSMRVTMAGTGSAFAKKYDNNNALIQSEGHTLLVDCGITLPKALYEMGHSFDELDAVLISHIHGDHVGGLEELAFQMMFKYSRKPVLYIEERLVAPLWEQTLRGGMTQGPLGSLDDFFDVRPLKEGVSYTLVPGLTVELIKTRHIPGKDSFSFLFNNKLFYTADMRFDAGLLTSLLAEERAETILHDCQFEAPGAVHACLDELLTLPPDIQEKVWLMHYGDAMEDYRGKTGKMRFVEQRVAYEF